MKRLSSVFVVMIALLAVGMPAAWAGAAKMSIDPVRVQWDAEVDYERAVLTVSMPGGEVVRKEFDSKQTPFFDLAAGAKDGAYTFELRLEARIDASLRRALAEARQNGDEAAMARLRAEVPESPVVSGGFMVEAGSIVVPEGKEPRSDKGKKAAAAGAVRNVTAADQVIPDDLIVQGSTCVGFDCVNNESFGFDTIRLKENNTRIKFEDTSVGTFPTNDWQLTANDSASGGSSQFSIEDITGAKVPFTVTAGASTNSIFVDSTGRVGFRTSTPVLDLHVATSNTPAIRLEQNNSGGFTAQTWDIAGNEANFFVRDVTGGSRLPFRIRPGAPTSSVDISADGDVGVGTASPANSLHVSRSDGTAKILVEENSGTATSRELLELRNLGGVAFILDDENDASKWSTSAIGSSYNINNQAVAGTEVTITSTGSMTITGTLTQNSDRTTKTDIEAVDPDNILAKVAALPIATWRKKGEAATHLGPMAQDFSAAFGLGDDERRVAPLDVAGVSLAAIQALHKEVSEKDAEISGLKQKNDDMAKRLADLEALVSSLAARQ
jgi:hypothetical protein